MIKKIIQFFKSIQKKRELKKRLEKLRKLDPFIYD